jgi:hypothetical protein
MENNRRTNHRLRAVVHYAQALAKESRANAADYLRRHECPVEVAVRVLVRERRAA